MKLNEITSRKDVEDQFQKLLVPRVPKTTAQVEPTVKTHTIRQSEQPITSKPEDTFAINRRLDKKLKLIKDLRVKLQTLKPRVMATAKEFGHRLPADFLLVDDNKYLYLDPDMPDQRSMEQRHDDLIQAYQSKLEQIKMYLKYPHRYLYS